MTFLLKSQRNSLREATGLLFSKQMILPSVVLELKAALTWIKP